MQKSPVERRFVAEARTCARVMQENAAYLRKELPKVTIPPDLGAKVSQLWDRLATAQYSVTSELSRRDDVSRSGRANPEALASFAGRMMHGIAEDVLAMHNLIQSLECATTQREDCGAAYVLVAGSGVNILKACTKLTKASTRTQRR